MLAAARLRPSKTVMVGDRRYDVLGALENQVFPTGVLWGYGSREELCQAGVRLLFEKPHELAQFAI